MTVTYRNDLRNINWPALKAALAADKFDNGRTPEQLRLSFQTSRSVCIAWNGSQVIGTARVLSDGVCNAYLVDVWTLSDFRRQGIGTEMATRLCTPLAGQHIYLQVDKEGAEFYRRLGFSEQPVGMSRVIGRWLDNNTG
jgi:ribosomal protein S18 acetylase RimI-like enzyme